jgi:hypothetical protein
VFDKREGNIYPRAIKSDCKMGKWNEFYVTFSFDGERFKRGMVFHLINGELKQERYRERET